MSGKIEHINWHLKKGLRMLILDERLCEFIHANICLNISIRMRKGALFTPENLLVNMPFVFCVFRSEMMMTKREKERDGNNSPESHLHKGSKTKALHIAQYSLSGHKAQVK